MRQATVADRGISRMARWSAGRSVRPMFRSIVIGYDGPGRGDEAVALAALPRDPRRGTLLLTSAYPLASSLTIGGYVVPEEIDALRDQTKAMLAAARDAIPAGESPEAEAALQAAEALALGLRAAPTVDCAGALTSPSRTAEDHARQLLWAVSDNAPEGLQPETLLLHGEPATEIAARAHGVIDILFTGSGGYGPLRRALLGSVSGALVREAGCPVVVTPQTTIAHDDPAPKNARTVPA